MKRLAIALPLAAFAVTLPASAATHQASVGNYWYEEDTQRDQTKITVRQGDQIRFTVRQAAVPGHTVDVDALNIHSPNLSIGQTFTTPRLTRAGNFYLYCRPHEQRGHYTRLVVLAAPKATPAPAPKPTPQRSAAPQRTAVPARVTSTPTPSAIPTTAAPRETLTPVGVGTAPPGSLDRPVPTNPNSLAALTGRVSAKGVPWTRSLWWLAIASAGLIGAAAFALSRADFAQPAPPVTPPARKPPVRKKKPAPKGKSPRTR